MSEDIKKVYVGTEVEGLFIKEMLQESGIEIMMKDAFQSSIQAGWADGLPGDSVRIFVKIEMYDKAKKLIDEYFAQRDSK